MKFHIVDVFAEEKYAGNPLAVVPDAGDLTTEEMQTLTREFHFSESTFITGKANEDGSFPVRIFTPAEEVPFAGHPTVGTAWVINNLINKEQASTVTLDLQIGKIPVSFTPDGLASMMTRPPSFGNQVSVDAVANTLGLVKDDIDQDYPIQVVSTGLPALIVPLKDLKAMQDIKVSSEKMKVLSQTTDIGKVTLVFCSETMASDCQLHVRVFCPLVDIPEDPATGSANSCLAGYLAKYQYFDTDKFDIQVEQGLEINRPSRLYLKAKETDNNIAIQVGGRVQLVAEGKLI